jgi:hypothetical protein
VLTVQMPSDATGTVGFYDFAKGSAQGMGVAPIINGLATLTKPTVPLVQGNNPIQASFTGDARWAANDSNFVTVTILTPAPMRLSASPTTVPLGQAPVLTVQMPSDATGTVGFYDTTVPGTDKGIGVAPIINGVATLTSPSRPLVQGDNSIYAWFGGDAKWAAHSSNTVPITVNPAPTTPPTPAPPSSAPAITNLANGDGQVAVSFSGGSAGTSSATSYEVTATDLSEPGTPPVTAKGQSSPITVTGLTNGDNYQFTVLATSANGASSAPSSNERLTVGVGSTGGPANGVGSESSQSGKAAHHPPQHQARWHSHSRR